jgi:hypothetical protein
MRHEWKPIVQFIVGGVLTLLTGTLIYLLFRPETLRVFDWLRIAGPLHESVLVLRESVLPVKPYLILLIWKNELNKSSLVWILSVPILAVFSESAQAIGLIPGTFDTQDLVSYISCTLTPIILFSNNRFNF